jgi:hypothetical protein
VAAAVVEHEPDFVGAGVLAHLLQETFEAEPIDVRQEQHGPAHRLDRGIEPEPMVLMLMDPGRAAAERAPQPAVCHLQTEPGLVHGEGTASRDTFSSFFKCRLLGGAVAVMRPTGLQLAPPEQLGNGIDAVHDVPGIAQINLRLPPMARLSACKPSHASGVIRSTMPRRCGGASSPAKPPSP